MLELSELAKEWSKRLEKNPPKTPQKALDPLDPLNDTPVVGKKRTEEREQPAPPISKRRSPTVNAAHVEILFAAFELEWGRKWSKGVEESPGGRSALMQHWLKRMRTAELDEMSLNAAMARLSGDWPPSLDAWISLCRPHTYEARVGQVEKYSADRPEPGPGYEKFREYVERHKRRGK